MVTLYVDRIFQYVFKMKINLIFQVPFIVKNRMTKSSSEYDICQTKLIILTLNEIKDYDVNTFITCKTCHSKVQPRFVHDSCGDYYCIRCDKYGNVKHYCLKCKYEQLYD